MNRIFDPVEPIDLSFETAAPEQQLEEAPVMPAQAAAPPAALSPERAAGTAAAPPATPEPEPAGAAALPLRSRNRSPRLGRSARPSMASDSDRTTRSARRIDDRLVLGSALAGVCTLSVAGSLIYFGYWNRLQQNLTQERNLLLVERLRSLGPANPAPVPAAPLAAPTLPATPDGTSQSGAEGLPPPPPDEPWMRELSALPRPSATPPRVLTVPVSPRLGAAAPAAASATAPPASASPATSRSQPSPPVPQLVGVVGSPGRSGSAIFLVGGSSMSVESGQMIGSSGWRLRTAEGETALIERDGDVRQVSIASGNGF